MSFGERVFSIRSPRKVTASTTLSEAPSRWSSTKRICIARRSEESVLFEISAKREGF